MSTVQLLFLAMYQAFQTYLENTLFQHFDLQSRPIPAGLEQKTSDRGKHPATIRSWCYACPELRKIRYTYIDAGASAQIFNCVMYPNFMYDLPLFGLDFLSFGKVKHLVILDFQPLFRDATYLAKYTAPLQGLRDRYPDLAQDLEMKVYDADRYFSPHLLFAKTTAETVQTQLFAAFKEALNLYLQLLKTATPLTQISQLERIQAAQKDYDQYIAERDPAAGLFCSYFGHEWSERFLYEFLFEDARPIATAVG